MKTIWKYEIDVDDYVQLMMPAGAEVLSVQEQNGDAQMWALVDPSQEKEVRLFRVYGTGHICESDYSDYIGTFQLHDGGLVFHVFEDN